MYIHSFIYGRIPIEIWEIPAMFMLLLAVAIIGKRIEHSHRALNPHYRYYTWGLLAKIFGGIFFGCIYVFYYKHGDSTGYYECAVAFTKLFHYDFPSFLKAYFGPGTIEIKSLFTSQTGEPMMYMFGEDKARFVIKLVVPFLLLTGGSYFLSTALIAIVTYSGLWRLYMMFVSHFPQQSRSLAIAILFMPSVICWGSGILKDSFTLAATCHFIVATNNLISKKGSVAGNWLLLLTAGFFVLSIKAYILIILLPGTFIWYFYDAILRIRNQLLRVLVVPLTYAVIIGGSYGTLNLLGDRLGRFSIDQALETAAITNRDLKKDYYEGNSFDIGDFDPSLGGIVSKIPAATVAGLFRPFVWDAKNVVMMLSGLENLFILGMTIVVLFSVKPRVLMRVVMGNPVILYCLFFSVLFAFMTGLTTPNFGALVRFKIPLIPLYMSAIMVLFGQLKSIRIYEGRDRRLIF
jgi:hypothetical protein